MTLGSLGKALGPTLGAVLFAWTINAPALGGVDPRVRAASTFVLYGATTSAVCAFASRNLPTKRTPAPRAYEMVRPRSPDDDGRAGAAANPLREAAPAPPPSTAPSPRDATPLIVEVPEGEDDDRPPDAAADPDEFTDDEDEGIDADAVPPRARLASP